MRKFRAKKRKKHAMIKILLYLILILLTVYITFDKLYCKTIQKVDGKKIVNILFTDKSKKSAYTYTDYLLDYTLDLKNKTKKKSTPKIVKVVKQINEEKPLVYIYNTHQTEEYRKTNNNDYNITPTVLHASYILKNKLQEHGIYSIVEENSIKDILNANGWNYNNSYRVSKMLAEDALSINPSIKYVIDLHRDSIPEYLAKTSINGKDYAKVMIVLGKGHDSFDKNLDFANRINNYLIEFSPSITRGIDIKEKSGIFNQDICNNAILIEVGGPYNDIDSVSNTMDVLSNIYVKVIKEDGN